MKKKLTTLLFGLLLAVGWTSTASAQALPQGGFAERSGLTDIGVQVNNTNVIGAKKKASVHDIFTPAFNMSQEETRVPFKPKAINKPERVNKNAPLRAEGDKMKSLTKAEADNLKYTWTDAQGTSHESKATDEATDPYQMYELLRFVYGNPAFPGPLYSAYKPDGTTREDPVYYGAVAGGWNISAAGSGSSVQQVITIATSDTYAFIDSIYVKAGDQLLTSYGGVAGDWNSSTYAAIFPTGWTASPTATYYVSGSDVYAYFYQNGGGTITIPKSLLQDNSTVQVYVEGIAASSSTASTITVNGETQSLSSENATLSWTVTFPEVDPDAFVQGTVEAPTNNEGYTALVVSVKDDATAMSEPSAYNGSCEFSSKLDIVNYFSTRIQSIKLLTDGIRIGSDEDYSAGTVFSCDGTYNKFFFLGKGQARKKADAVLTRINNSTWPAYCGEEVPFENMFEQFSPTTGGQGDQITDFYSKMNEGNVYPVVHDCASVIQNGHQFSMSGNDGTTSYAMTGLNFFIPDYRLMWYRIIDSDYSSTAYVDGRDMNPYCSTNSTTGNHNSSSSTPKYFAAWFAQYNTSHAPKVGIYKITLDATAEPVAQLYAPGNKNYQVTLTWVSSLNEMSGHDVPQTYTVWYFDENGERQYVVAEGITNGQTGLTTITYLVEQFEHSYTIDYIVQGSPDDTEHPQFIAISNIDGVVIPGWNDFVGLELDHHESDFVVADMANWYRNFLSVVNEDLYNGLTVSAVTGANGNTPMNKFSLYRYNYNGTKASGAETKVADIELFDATPAQVSYRVTYDDDASDADMEDQQVLEAKYQREAMGFKDEGVIRVRGNGDLVIWPNNYFVNFKTITVKNGTQPVTSWNAATMNTLPVGWETSPGSKWEEFTHNGVKVGYMEGGGYIYIPNMLNRYNNLSVEIEAFGEGANVKRITVNDETKDITATAAGTTYTWTSLSPNALHAPKMATESHTSSLVFTANCNGSGTADDGATWTVKSDATEQAYEAARGIHYGSGSKSVSYVELSTSDIPGTIKKVVVNASRGSGSYSNAATLNVTVNGAAFGTSKTITTSAAEYTFEGSASGDIVVRLSQTSRARALYCKSITVYYEVEGEDTPTEGGLLRMHMLLVDQFKQEIPADNSHPDAYGYVLRFEPNGPNGDGKKQSGTVKVDIEKTDAQPNSYYTKSQIDNDKNIDTTLLTMDILDAQVKMNLNDENPNVLYFQMQGAGKNAIPDTYLTQLQYMKNVRKYEEMLEGSHKGEQYDADEVHYYFNDATPEVGSYTAGDYKAYAPSVSTWGIDRRYFEADGLNNTYGAPVWKTAVGQAKVLQVKLEKQVAKNGGVNQSTTWTDANGASCDLYILDNILVDGYLPSADISNVKYVPYMFRVFVKSPSGKLRHYIPVEGTETTGSHLVNDPEFTNFYGPISVYEQNVQNESIKTFDDGKGVEWSKSKNTTNWSDNAIFGALSNMIQGTSQGNNIQFDSNDLQVFVRFYYMVEGWNANRGGEARPGNGSESPGFAPSPWTAVDEVRYNGEVVSTTYVNAQGVISEKPFDGFNIVITRYSDGTTRTTKVMQ